MSATSPPPPSSTGSDEENDPFEEITEDGVSYLVAPVTAQVSGVYRYPAGRGVSRELVEGETLTADAGDGWDGRPLTLNHPVVNRDGKPTYGLTTGPQASYTTVGEFRDSDRSTDEKLRGRVWIEQGEIGQHDGVVEEYIEDVRAGGYGDVSPGYNSVTVNEYGSFNGESYSGRQAQITPDHVAILPDEDGNCSIADGCGVGRANTSADEPVPRPRINAAPVEVTDDSMTPSYPNDGEPRVNIRTEARTPEYDGTVTADESEDEHVWWGLTDYLDAYLEETDEEFSGDPHSALSSIPDGARGWIANHTLLGSEDSESEDNLLMFEVVSPEGVLYEERLDDILGSEGGRATIPEEQRESAREVARDLLEEEFDRDFDRTNADVTPEEIDAEDVSQFQQAWSTVNTFLSGVMSGGAPRVNQNEEDVGGDGSEDSETDENSNETTGADTPSDADPNNSDNTTMENENRTQILVDEHGFDMENLPDEGEDCFDRIYDKFAGDGDDGTETETEIEDGTKPEGGDGGEGDDVGTETADSPDLPDGVELNEEGEAVVNLDSIDDVVDERVEQRLEEEQSSAERKRTEEAIVNSGAPFDADDLENMNDAAVEAIAEKHNARSAEQRSAGQSASYAGVPQPTVNADQTSEDNSGAPIAGYGNNRNSGGDN